MNKFTMKKYIFLILSLTFLLTSHTAWTNPIHDTVVMGPGYESDVFYSMQQGVIKVEPRNNWDLGFYTNRWSAGIIINEGTGVQLFTYPHGDTTAWDSMDFTDMDEWQPMHNSDTIWEDGAFSYHALGHPDYGWGIYNMITHDVVGDSLFVLQLANGSFKKLWMQQKNSTLNIFYFKYADLDGNNEVEAVLDVTPYQDNRMFIYYDLQMQQVVDREPDINEWDLMWSRYAAIVYDLEGNPSYYIVVGVLSNLEVGVSKFYPVAPDFNEWFTKDFEEYMTPIGHDWKEFDMNQFAYVIPDSLAYFVRSRQGDVYKLEFEYFSGTATGQTGLVKELISMSDVKELSHSSVIRIYPNPATDHVLIDLSQVESPAMLRIYELSGKLVDQQYLTTAVSFNLPLNGFTKGMYIIEIESDTMLERQKLLIR
jgi:hypothetical protein